MIDRHVVTDLGRLADDHAGGVVDEHALAEHGGGMDVDPRERCAPGSSTIRARSFKSFLPQPVADAVAPDGVDARVADRDLERRARCRVTLACRRRSRRRVASMVIR